MPIGAALAGGHAQFAFDDGKECHGEITRSRARAIVLVLRPSSSCPVFAGTRTRDEDGNEKTGPRWRSENGRDGFMRAERKSTAALLEGEGAIGQLFVKLIVRNESEHDLAEGGD